MSSKARQQAQAEGLTLRVAENSSGYYSVRLDRPGRPKPYQARGKRGGKDVHLGGFATAEEAALCVARSPEGRAAAGRAASPAVPLLSEEEEAPAASPGSLNPRGAPSPAARRPPLSPPLPRSQPVCTATCLSVVGGSPRGTRGLSEKSTRARSPACPLTLLTPCLTCTDLSPHFNP